MSTSMSMFMPMLMQHGHGRGHGCGRGRGRGRGGGRGLGLDVDADADVDADVDMDVDMDADADVDVDVVHRKIECRRKVQTGIYLIWPGLPRLYFSSFTHNFTAPHCIVKSISGVILRRSGLAFIANLFLEANKAHF
jgi:hypothetical protein